MGITARPALDTSALDALSDIFLVVRDDVIVWANAAAVRQLGGPLVGRSFGDVVAPGEYRRLRLLERQRSQGWDLPATCRLRFVRSSDGAELVSDLRFGHEGGALVLSGRDVTEQRRAEDLMGALAQTFARGSTLLDPNEMLDAVEPIFEALMWKVALIEITERGSIARRVLAAPKGDPVGDYVRSIIDVELPFAETPMVASVALEGRPLFLDNLATLLAGQRADATSLGASMASAQVARSAWCPVHTDGRLTHLLAVTGRDLTEHDFVAVQLLAVEIGAAMHMHELRSELVHKERLAAVGEMAAVMAHEVRNPLGVIFNAIAGLRKEPRASTTATDLLAILQEEAERLRRLVTDLLDFSRPFTLEVRTVAVEALVREAVDAAQLDPSVAATGKHIRVELASDTTIETDPLLLRRALINLFVNALQNVSEDGGVDVVVSGDGDRILLAIHNDGPPIAPEAAARLFEPFFTTRAAGTGLGLAVVRRIVDDLGGGIVLETSEGRGTTFRVALPARRGPVS